MRSKLASLILLSFFNLAFGWTPINPDNAPSIQQDPFINNAINISNWQSGGKFDDFGYFRGNVANEKSTVSINPVMNFRMGSFSVQNATLTGTHYFETRFNNHPHWEHSPFDEVRENSASSKESFISGSQSGYDMSWKTLKIHPGDGYDGAQGGGYPTPAGAYDAYYVNLDGFATATYFVPIWDKVEIPTNNSKDPLENMANAHQSGKDKITSSIYSDKSVIEKMLGVFNGTVEATIGTVGAGVGTPFNNVTEYGWNQYLHTTGNIEIKSVQMLPVSVQNDYINFIGNSLTQESMSAVTNAASLWLASGGKLPSKKKISETKTTTNSTYQNQFPNDIIDTPKIVSIDQAKVTNGTYNYVITTEGELILGKTGHTSLNAGQNVLAAGEVKFVNNEIKFVDNASGHYQPTPNIEKLVEHTFNQAGVVADGKFVAKVWVPDPKHIRGGQWKPEKK